LCLKFQALMRMLGTAWEERMEQWWVASKFLTFLFYTFRYYFHIPKVCAKFMLVFEDEEFKVWTCDEIWNYYLSASVHKSWSVALCTDDRSGGKLSLGTANWNGFMPVPGDKGVVAFMERRLTVGNERTEFQNPLGIDPGSTACELLSQ
jgi:hypothetical protein